MILFLLVLVLVDRFCNYNRLMIVFLLIIYMYLKYEFFNVFNFFFKFK